MIEAWMEMSKPGKYILSLSLLAFAAIVYFTLDRLAYAMIPGAALLFCTIVGIGDDPERNE